MLDVDDAPSFNATSFEVQPEVQCERKNMAQGVYDAATKLTEIVQMRGNFWRTHGFSENQKNYLYCEEALYLVEKSSIYVEQGEQIISFKDLYTLVINVIPLACYLTYVKLKSLDYITFRHSDTVRVFKDDVDVYNFLVANPSANLLESLVSFNVFPNSGTFSKKNQRLMGVPPPVGYVVVMTGQHALSPRIVMKLLEEAKGIPIIFAIMTNSGHILLEEYTDALKSLQWNNPVAMSMEHLLDPEEEDNNNDNEENCADDIDEIEDDVGVDT